MKYMLCAIKPLYSCNVMPTVTNCYEITAHLHNVTGCLTLLEDMLIIIIIIKFINCNWLFTRWQWLFYMYTKYVDHMKFAVYMVFFFVYHILSCSSDPIFIIVHMVVMYAFV